MRRRARVRTTVSVVAGLSLIAAAVASTAFLPARADEPENWAGREASLAVVNPTVRSPLQEVISLRGTWDFSADPSGSARIQGWMNPGAVWPGLRSITVPGCWEAQGVGKPGASVTWDCHWDCGQMALRTVYMGSAWYRRAVDIPKTWQGKRVWLKIGGVRAQGWFWVNGRFVSHLNNYCGTYKYDITDLVSPGKGAVVVALVRNDLPSRKGAASWIHRAGGLYRDVEIEATPDTWIDNCWVQGDFDRRAAVVHLTVRTTPSERPRSLLVDVQVRTLDGKPAGRTSREISLEGKNSAELACEVPLLDFRPWSPDSPRLYLADATLRDGHHVLHGWRERFGVRKLEVRGKRFFLNDQPFFVRGFGDDIIYPETLVSPASREVHRQHLDVARRSGFIYVRHHTHCEMPEFYEAADEAGILIQPELPYYGHWQEEGACFDPKRDLAELIGHYQRYVSLATCCMGNEGSLGSPLDQELYAMVKRLNAGLLVIHQDGGNNTAKNSDFGSGRGAPDWGPYPQEQDPRPWVHHEYLNLGLKCDPRLEPRFRGVMVSPRNVGDYENSLRRVGLSRAWGDACLDAGHALQRYYQKQGIEAARLNPACNGYDFWTIVDVLLAGQGLYNAFWAPKSGGATPEEFRRFNGPTALLVRCDPASPIAVAGQTIACSWRISHFGDKALTGAKLAWRLREGDNVLASGSLEHLDVAMGDVRALGAARLTIPELSHPVQAVLEAKIEGVDVDNHWDLWLFPKRTAKAGTGMAASAKLYKVLSVRYPGIARLGTPEGNAADVLVTASCDADAMAALKAGRRVLTLESTGTASNVSLGWWGLGNQTGTAILRHPALGNFPHAGCLSPLWFRIVKIAPLLQPEDKFRGAEPLMVGEGRDGYAVYLSQARIGRGRLLRACGLDVLADEPECAALLDAMLDYVRGDAFAPQATLPASF